MGGSTRIGQDFGAGVLFVTFGAIALKLSSAYQAGTALRMGPGYLPQLLSWLLLATGLIVALRAVVAGDVRVERWHARPLLFVIGGMIAFSYLIEPAGLLVSSLATLMLGAVASREFRPVEAAIFAVALAFGSIALFVLALGLPMKIWPG